MCICIIISSWCGIIKCFIIRLYLAGVLARYNLLVEGFD